MAMTGTRDRRRVTWAVTASLALTILATATWERLHPPPPSLEAIHVITVPGILDWRGTKVRPAEPGRPLTLVLRDQKRVVYVSAEGSAYSELRPPEPVEPLAVDFFHDFDGDGLLETVVSSQLGSEFRVSVYNRNNYELRRFTAQGPRLSREDPREVLGGMWGATVADLEGDGQREMFGVIASSFPPSPRGLLCFNCETQQLLWQHLIGPYIIGVEASDLDGDGVREVIVGTYAACNGNVAPDESDDHHSYVYVFGPDGSVRWRVPLGDDYTQTCPIIATADADQRPELYVCLTAAGDHRQRMGKPLAAAVLRLSMDGEIVSRRDFGADLWGATAADLDGDGRAELLATDWEGSLHLLDHDLRLLSSVNLVPTRYTRAELKIAFVTDLDGDRVPEIVLTGSQHELATPLGPAVRHERPVLHILHQNEVIVLNSRLTPLTRYLVAAKWLDTPMFQLRLAALGPDRRSALALLTHQAAFLALRP